MTEATLSESSTEQSRDEDAEQEVAVTPTHGNSPILRGLPPPIFGNPDPNFVWPLAVSVRDIACAAPYQPTLEDEGNERINLMSISAMPLCRDYNAEEMRFATYELRRKLKRKRAAVAIGWLVVSLVFLMGFIIGRVFHEKRILSSLSSHEPDHEGDLNNAQSVQAVLGEKAAQTGKAAEWITRGGGVREMDIPIDSNLLRLLDQLDEFLLPVAAIE
jgi:hypothetical protein